MQDALDACALGADLIGLNFVPDTKRYLNPYVAKEILEALPPFVTRVGVFADEELNTVNDMAEFIGLDVVQLHGHEGPDYCAGITLPVIKAVRVGGSDDLTGLKRFKVSAFLLDASVDGELGGTGKSFPWELASSFCVENRVFVAGGLTPENVGIAVKQLMPYGVDTSSGVEESPGRKNYELMKKFIIMARCAAIGNGGGCSDIAC
jgi:phosphoribosylanthranilate isomerase